MELHLKDKNNMKDYFTRKVDKEEKVLIIYLLKRSKEVFSVSFCDRICDVNSQKSE
jgi:hypothetical protein